MNRIRSFTLAVLLLMPLTALHAVEVANLRCEHLKNPLGNDVANPRLSWVIEEGNQIPEARSQMQTAYQVLVASSAELLAANQGDLWDSGKVASDQSIAVRYAGTPLVSEKCYWWKVRVDDNSGRQSPWSSAAMFLTAKMRSDDWRGKWIGADLAPRTADLTLGFAVEANRADEQHWVQVDLGNARQIDRIVLHPMRHNDPAAGGWINGYAFPVRFRIEISDDATFATAEMVADFTQQDYANPGWVPVAVEAQGRPARYVRLTVTKMWGRGPGLPFAFTLGEFQVFSGANNIAAGAAVDASASVEASGWSKTQLTDGLALCPPAGDLTYEKPTHKHGAIYLRKEFNLAKPVQRAVLSFSGLGFSEVAIDGRKVGDYVIGPGFTDYEHRVQYLSFDVSDRFMTLGQKRLDVTLADGWYALVKDPWVHQLETKPYVDLPKLILDLRLIYADGTEAVVCSDESWNWSTGEITRSWIAGEDIDLRLAGENTRQWQPVVPVAAPKGHLLHQKETFNRIVEEVKPVSMRYDPVSKSCVWDLGRTINGWVRFKAQGPSGTQMRITTIPSVVGVEGAPHIQTWTSLFTLAGSGMDEVYEPRFFHAGMRKVEITGLSSEPAITDLVGCQISSMQTPAGGFRCSDETTTAIHDSVRRTVVSYTTFLPNDPMREWKAWTQDIQSMFGSASYLFAESQVMYERWQHDLLDSQLPDGNMANVAPGPVFDAYNSPWWGGCGVWLPWEWRLVYGDESLLTESYPAMKRYVDFLETEAGKANGLQTWGLPDWLAVEETPTALINTPAHYRFARIVSSTAEKLGLPNDATKYSEMAEDVKDTLNTAFLDPVTGIYGEKGWQIRKGNGEVPGGLEPLHSVWWNGDRPSTQAGQVMPLALGMVPDAARPAVESALLREIAAHKGRLSTGFVSTPYLLDVLMDLAPEVCWRMTTAREYPSWYGMTLGSGNDLMKETWAGGAAIMPSLGGNFARWCYRGLGGIRPDESAPGFKKIIIKPAIVGNLTWVECWHDSNYGRIVSNWQRAGSALTMDVTIPPNTTATVYVPAKDAASVTEAGHTLGQVQGIQFLRMENNAAVYAVGSGSYRFQSIMSSARANTILLTDNFNETPDNEVAASFNNNLASTQGGTLSTPTPVTYNVQGANFTAQHSNAGHLLFANDAVPPSTSTYGNVSLNNNFATQANAANQPLKISFNIHSVFGYADPTRWVQFNLGNAQNLDVANTAVGAGVIFRKNGESAALNGGSVIGSASTWSADDLVAITLSGTGGVGSAFNGNGSVATISIGANNLGTFTLAQQTNAYLNFSAFNYSNDQFGGGTFDNLNVALVSPGYDYAIWGASYGLSAGSEGGDLDNDGLTNQKEYAFGLIPNSGASVNPITVPFNKNTVTFTYTRRDPVTNPTGLTYTVWTSTNLVDWSPETNLTAVQSPGAPDGNGIQSVGVTLTPAPTAPKFFVQVRAN